MAWCFVCFVCMLPVYDVVDLLFRLAAAAKCTQNYFKNVIIIVKFFRKHQPILKMHIKMGSMWI